jgi:hypothetical protein
MKRSLALIASMTCVAAPPAHADVAMDLVTRNAAGQETDRTVILAQSNKLRMDEGKGESRNTMIFLGDELLVLDHIDKTYIVMDETMLDDVSSQINEAMQQMQEELARLPPEQRAMAEQMMKGRMPGMTGRQDVAPTAPRVEALGSGQWQSYSCQNYAVYQGTAKTQELCAAALKEIDGADEMMQAFRGMAAFMAKLMESLPMQFDTAPNPGELMDQIDGFPVHMVDYRNGAISSDTSLESVVEKDLDEAVFAAPEGYTRDDPFGGR